jgi:hypothetical protein
MMLACQTQKDKGETENTPKKVGEVSQSTEPVSSKSGSDFELDNKQCYTDICLHLRNHDASNKSFEIYMINTVPIAGFQCDLPGIDITGSDGGLLKENGYQTSNSDFRILSFSMQAKLIPVGMGISPTLIAASLVMLPPESMVKVAKASNASVSKELFVKVNVTEKPSPGLRIPSLSNSLSSVISGLAVNMGAPYKLFSIS